jgi:hypothetical protein
MSKNFRKIDKETHTQAANTLVADGAALLTYCPSPSLSEKCVLLDATSIERNGT